ncbi:MAG TPA: peptidyl-prolyl cis-trans isomerase [Chthoniobacterales bacterium]
MLDSIRRRQRTLLTIITVVVIVAFAWLYNPAGSFRRGAATGQIGKLNGRTVTVEEIQKLDRNLGIALQLGMYELPSQLATDGRSRDEQALSFAWNLLILRDATARLGLNPAPDRIKEAEKKLPNFQTDGRFDGGKYQKFVDTTLKNNGLGAADLDEVVTDDLRLQDLNALLQPAFQLPEAMFKSQYEALNLKMHVGVIPFKRVDFEKGIQISDDEIKKYYDEQKERLQTPEKRKLTVASFTLKEDQRQLTGEKRNQALKPLAEQAEAFMQPVLDKPAEFENVAAQKGVPLQQTGVFAAAQPDPLVSGEPAVLRQSFSLTKDNPVSDIVQGANGFYVVKLLEVELPKPLTLEQARDQILDALKKEKAEAGLRAASDQARQKIAAAMKTGQDFLTAARDAGYHPESPAPFSLAEAGPENDVARVLTSDRVMLEPGETSNLLQDADGGLLVHLISRDPLDEAKYADEKKKEYPLADQRFSSLALREWLKVEQQKAGRPPV